jgi:hypothetical protein
MLEKFVHELERVAPGHPETVRARRALTKSNWSRWRMSGGLLVVLVPLLATLGHALVRALGWRTRAGGHRPAAVVGLALFVCALSGSARAYGPDPVTGKMTSWPIDDKDPESAVPTEAQRNRSPLEFAYWLQDVIDKGQLAAKAGDHEAAVRYYRAVVKAVPDRAIGVTRLCEEYEALGELDKALTYCQTALSMDGARFYDYERYVKLMLKKPGDLSKADISDLTKVFAHLHEDKTIQANYEELECQFASRTKNVSTLQRCVADLKTKAPMAPRTALFELDLALIQGDFGQARQLLDAAKAGGTMPPDVIQRMEKELTKRASAHLGLVGYGLIAGAFLVIAAAAAATFTRLRRRGEKGRVAIAAASAEAGP